MTKTLRRLGGLLGLCLLLPPPAARAQHGGHPAAPAAEGDYYALASLPLPEGVVLEVGGMAVLPDGRLAVSTRRGEVWLVGNPAMRGGRPHFRRFAHGLHEALGLAYRDGALYAAQRGELTRLVDRDGDDRADRYETVYRWPLEGNYHEYAYGPVVRDDGTLLVTLNLAWVGHGASLSKWHGWMLEVTPDGRMTPYATGMRSPAGFALTPSGDVFYAENQGDWVGSGYITHVARGDFVGNPAGLRWTGEPGVPERLRGLRPEDIPDTGEPLFDVARRVPQLKPPAVWFPHTITGISTSGILADTTAGAFGPFAGQLFVGDQGHSKILRVFLEQVDGVYQGAVFPFREGFASGVLRMVWGKDGAMYVGMTSRGWDALGKEPYGLQRLAWTGRVPFEVQSVRARPDGFELAFTQPVDRAAAADPSAYAVRRFTYHYHHHYGSPPIDVAEAPVRGVAVAEDGRSARLVVDGLREGFIHELKLPGVRSAEGQPLLHPVAYYTLNRLPGGDRAVLAAPAPGGGGLPAPAVTTAGEGGGQPRRRTEPPAGWTDGPDVSVTVGTLPGLRFDAGLIEVRAGSRVRVVFNNDDDMLHNFVVTAPGRADAVAEAALALGLDGHDRGYVPDTGDVLFHTALLQPHAAEALHFVAPAQPADYPFVCTFPGHAVTMRGVLRVVP